MDAAHSVTRKAATDRRCTSSAPIRRFRPATPLILERHLPSASLSYYDGRVLALDYESPNSSDVRIIKKDVDAYCRWNVRCKKDIPYVIITTLPNVATDGWELRWTAAGRYNHRFAGRRAEVCRNPFAFWTRILVLGGI